MSQATGVCHVHLGMSKYLLGLVFVVLDISHIMQITENTESVYDRKQKNAQLFGFLQTELIHTICNTIVCLSQIHPQRRPRDLDVDVT